jgi:hypothetical protein
MVELLDELLVMVSFPLAVPVVAGSNVSVMEIDWPGFSVAGRLTADDAKPLPDTTIELTVTGAVPVDVSVSICVVELFTVTAPKATLLAFALNAGVPALSCRETLFAEPPVVAVMTADCELLTEDTFAVKAAVDAAAGTVTEPGTLTELLLLERLTLTPPVGADPERLTVQASASEPVTEVLPQATELIVGVALVPVPLRLTETAGALLEIASCPVNELAVAGLN